MNPSHPQRIHLLSEQLANQIAAGEVVERPASVLKELLENALDAGASQIDVEVEKGGMVLLRVRDNGQGIHADDLSLAISRHATSKIDSLRDLEALFSLGFRGEALASISSVSRMRLTSRCQGCEQAWSIEAQGRGSVPMECPASHPVGTSVEVRELFFNTPARRKFLRSEKTEFNHLDDVFRRAALSRPEVGFSLSHNQRQVHRYRPRSEDEWFLRIEDVCGRAASEAFVELREELDELSLHGWLSTATEGRSSTDLQYFFLNGRMVRDKLIQHAIRQAYEGVLPAGRHAAYVLYLQLPAEEVDVNVHPTKHEVRFQQSRKVHDFLVVALRRQLPRQAAMELGRADEVAEPRADYRRPAIATPAAALSQRSLQSPRPRLQPVPPPPATQPVADDSLLALVEGRYALLQTAQGLRVLDTLRAGQWLIQNRLQRLLQGPANVSPLLFPAQCPLPASLMPALEAWSETLTRLGLRWEAMEGERIRITAAPEVLQEVDLQGWLVALLQQDVDPRQGIEPLLSLLARLGAEHRRYPYNQSELGQLIQRLQALEHSGGEQPRLWLHLDAEALQRLMGEGE